MSDHSPTALASSHISPLRLFLHSYSKKMSDATGNTDPGVENSGQSFESLHRVAKIPVIETTLNKASEMYTRLKEASETVNSVLTTAENTVKKAAETAQPVATKLEGPIKKVDSVLCSGLDFVEEKVPAIKLPPNELAQKTKDAINSNVVEPAMKGISTIGEYGKQKVASFAGYQNETKPEGDEKK